MPHPTLLADLIALYGVALVLIVLFARLRIPAIVAMILAGLVAGPHALGLVPTQSDVDLIAEIGIVLLLFTVGLDFSMGELRRIWRATVVGGTLQIALTAAIVTALVVVATATPPRSALFIGLFVSLSSTAIVLKEMAARNELSSPQGRVVTGVLLFQDLCIVILLLMVPILGGEVPIANAGGVLLRAALALAVVGSVGRLVLPVFIRWVLRSGRREAFPIAVVLASVGTAWASTLLGVSMALGAFLGGLVLAESEFSHQAHAEIRPFRDVLSSLFFISLGLLLDPRFVLSALPLIAASLGAIVVVKGIAGAAALLAFSPGPRVAVAAALALSQVGEFSFVLGRAGVEARLLPPDTWQLLLAASVGTMMVTPALLAVAPRIGARFGGVWPRGPAAAATEVSGHVIIVGFGAGGRLIASTLRDFGVPHLVLDLNGRTIREGRAAGEPMVYADASNPDSLRAAGIARARALVLVMSDFEASLRTIKTARDLAPDVPIVVRARYRGEAGRMMGAGASVAVAEELEASLEVLSQLLARVGVPGNLSEAALDGLRRETETTRPLRARPRPLDAVTAVRHTPVATHALTGGDWAIGRTLAELNLRAETGALVLAVESAGRRITSPGADLELHEGDVLYLVGDDSDVLLARRRLKNGDSPH